MSADYFVESFAEHQVADLRSNVNSLDSSPCQSVSESDGPVCSSTSWYQETVLVRRPSHGLNSSHMIVKFQNWLARVIVPDEKFVVIASRAKLLFIKAPLKATNLLPMTD